MIKCFDDDLRMGMTLTGEVADEFLLFGVDTNHGISGRQVFRFKLSHVFELGIAIGMGAHRFFLARLTLTQSVFFQQLANCATAGRRSHLP